MVADTDFLRYWRELDDEMARMGKRPAALGFAVAAWRLFLSPPQAVRILPGCGHLL